MRFWLKIIKNNQVVLRTNEMEYISSQNTKEFVDRVKTIIPKDCEIILHEVHTKDGITVIDWLDPDSKKYEGLFK